MSRGGVYWGAVILDWFQELNDLDFGRGDYKVLFFLCSEMNPRDNVASVRQKTIANELSMDKGNVSKAIKKLKRYQFIAKVDNGFMVNPHLFYVGKRDPQDRWALRNSFDALVGAPIYRIDEHRGELEIDR